jgi:hypothetical protein
MLTKAEEDDNTAHQGAVADNVGKSTLPQIRKHDVCVIEALSTSVKVQQRIQVLDTLATSVLLRDFMHTHTNFTKKIFTARHQQSAKRATVQLQAPRLA